MRCQPLCGASLCADGSTCGTLRPRSVAAGPRSHVVAVEIATKRARRRGSGVYVCGNECSYVSRCNFRADQCICAARAAIISCACRSSWCNRHGTWHDSDNPAPAAPPRARPRGAATQPGHVTAPTEAHGEADPTGTPSPCLPAAAVTHGSGHHPTHWALHLPSFQAEVLRSRTPRLSDAALPPTHPPPPQDHRHMLTTCWQHRPALKCEGARRL